ncbi:Hypothetical predicted protein [Mytilus galloprovincialis]|uniref:Uncharacterized protein n=2 Tax=Mytilus galloprovincialis TaxID=29158 RepID=A0A8B6FP80_MYTGA|nr:Hypothetical predicted protein [Mytilus galloprovincialis]
MINKKKKKAFKIGVMEKREMRDFLGNTQHYNPESNTFSAAEAAKAKFRYKGAHHMGSNPDAGMRTHEGGLKLNIFTQFRRSRSESCGSEGEPTSPIGSTSCALPPIHAIL